MDKPVMTAKQIEQLRPSAASKLSGKSTPALNKTQQKIEVKAGKKAYLEKS